MKVTAGVLQIIYEPTILGRLRPKHKEGITTSRQQCCEPRGAGKMKSMVPSRNASLAPGAAHHLIGDIPVAMHVLSMYDPPSARSVDHWADGRTWGRYPQSLPSIIQPLLAPRSTSGIVDKFPTSLGRSKGDTYTRSRLWAGLVLRR